MPLTRSEREIVKSLEWAVGGNEFPIVTLWRGFCTTHRLHTVTQQHLKNASWFGEFSYTREVLLTSNILTQYLKTQTIKIKTKSR